MKATPPFYYHILLFVSLFFVFKLWDIGINQTKTMVILSKPALWFSISYIISTFAIYCLDFYIFCTLLYKRKYLLYLLSIPLSLLCFVGFRYLLEEVIIYNIIGFHNYFPKSLRRGFYIPDNFFFGLPAVILSTVSFLFWQFLYYQSYNKQLQLENQRAQFDLLKSQISPHFLFNTLNSFYSDWMEKDQKTASDLLTLTNLLRYVITENDKEYVLLSGELEFLKNYVQLQKKRFENQLFLDFSITGNCSNQTILPSVLIQFAENLFKYGKLSDPANRAVIEIKIEVDYLTLKTSNLIVGGETYYATGTGLKTLEKRLEYAYKDTFSLHKEEKNDTFITFLRIPLQSNL